jgi:transcriptional regulator with XRE-family HTH domain
MSIALNQFVKEKRKLLGLTQEELSFKSGVGLRFIRELERG